MAKEIAYGYSRGSHSALGSLKLVAPLMTIQTEEKGLGLCLSYQSVVGCELSHF